MIYSIFYHTMYILFSECMLISARKEICSECKAGSDNLFQNQDKRTLRRNGRNVSYEVNEYPNENDGHYNPTKDSLEVKRADILVAPDRGKRIRAKPIIQPVSYSFISARAPTTNLSDNERPRSHSDGTEMTLEDVVAESQSRPTYSDKYKETDNIHSHKQERPPIIDAVLPGNKAEIRLQNYFQASILPTPNQNNKYKIARALKQAQQKPTKIRYQPILKDAGLSEKRSPTQEQQQYNLPSAQIIQPEREHTPVTTLRTADLQSTTIAVTGGTEENSEPQEETDQSAHEPEYIQDKKDSKAESKNTQSSGSSYEEHEVRQQGSRSKNDFENKNKHEKHEKGHYNKDEHRGEYSEGSGGSKKRNNSDGLSELKVKEEKGKTQVKHCAYFFKCNNQRKLDLIMLLILTGKNRKKGHSTHGEHNIVKKDEYIKKTKFYDEEHDDEEEKNHEESEGSHRNKKKHNKEAEQSIEKYHNESKAKSGHQGQGQHQNEEDGDEFEEGEEVHYDNEEERKQNKGNQIQKKWSKGKHD